MAITPKEALGTKLIQEQSKIDELEKFIDERLAANFDGRGGVSVGRPGGYSTFVIKAAIERFEQAGWEVKEAAGQQDGNYFTFTPKCNTR